MIERTQIKHTTPLYHIYPTLVGKLLHSTSIPFLAYEAKKKLFIYKDEKIFGELTVT
jgi:hypothetical protein